MTGARLTRTTEAELQQYLRRRRQRRTLSPSAIFLWEDLQNYLLIPASKIDYSQVTLMRKAASAQVQQAVYGVVGQSTIVRDGQAFDFSGSAAGAPRFARLSNRNALVADTWDVADNAAGGLLLPNNKAISIYGYQALSATPLIDAIRFTLGTVAAVALFNLAPVYTDMTSAIGYFDPPVFFAPGQVLQFDLLSEVAISAGAESFALLAEVAEPGMVNVVPAQSPGA